LTASNNSIAKIGGVVIGRNEGERLRECISSLMRDVDFVVYVDSGSTDNSLAIARSLRVEVIELDASIGFTAARARNAGFSRLLESDPNIQYVQFVDGDCEVMAGWIGDAARFLQEHPTVAVACGRRVERYPHRNFYHRLIDMEWNTSTGEAQACGGDALIRVAALRQVNGYRDTMIAGEDPELCVRLRSAGWKVWRLDREMTRHDIRMSSFRQWWNRTVRSGHAYAEGAHLHGDSPERFCVKEMRSIWLWGVLFPIVCLSLAWPTYGLSLLGMFAIYGLLLAKIVRYRMKSFSDSFLDAGLYALSCVISKWPQAIGMLKYLTRRLTGSDRKLIEYQPPASRKSDIPAGSLR
jgi:GT2 family glycosyltransferase